MRPVPKVAKTCEQCGVTFHSLSSDMVDGRGRFCSKPCFYANRKSRPRKSRSKTALCPRCGSPCDKKARTCRRCAKRSTPEREASVVKLYKSGLSSLAIQKNLGIQPGLVLAILRRNKVSARKLTEYSKTPVDIILRLYDRQESCTEIARCLDMSSSSVLYHINKHRIMRPRGAITRGILNWGFGRKLTAGSIAKRTATRRANHPPRWPVRGYHPITAQSEKSWLREIIIKRGHRCQVTGKSGRLSAHHLYNVSAYPERQWDEGNILVVLHALHRQFHDSFMGSSHKPTTPEDWERFIQSRKGKVAA